MSHLNYFTKQNFLIITDTMQPMKLKNRVLYFGFATLATMLISINLFAQERVRGTLRSPSGEALASATVTVKGTNQSVTTDSTGQFTIDAPQGSTLVISSVGFQNREVPVTGADINITLETAEPTLSEVVVIGYQTVRRRDLTGAVGIINPGDAKRNVANTIAE